MRCANFVTSECDGSAIGRYRWLGHPEYTPLCRLCVAKADQMGLTLVRDETSWQARAIAKSLPAKAIAA